MQFKPLAAWVFPTASAKKDLWFVFCAWIETAKKQVTSKPFRACPNPQNGFYKWDSDFDVTCLKLLTPGICLHKIIRHCESPASWTAPEQPISCWDGVVRISSKKIIIKISAIKTLSSNISKSGIVSNGLSIFFTRGDSISREETTMTGNNMKLSSCDFREAMVACRHCDGHQQLLSREVGEERQASAYC